MTYQDYKQGRDGPLLMAIINITPDSFSQDGLLYKDNNTHNHDAMLAVIEQAIIDGADIIDIGAESTRPGAIALNDAVERQRLFPLLPKIRYYFPNILLSIDTYKPSIAYEAVKAGIDVINDVTGLKNPKMGEAACHAKAYIAMVNLTQERQVTATNAYKDYTGYSGSIIDYMRQHLQQTRNLCLQHHIPKQHIILDPGFGFGIAPNDSLLLLHRLHELRIDDHDMLIGISRKSMFQRLQNISINERDNAAIPLHLHAARQGAAIIRTHAVKPLKQALIMDNLLQHNNQNMCLIAVGGNMGNSQYYFNQAFDAIEQFATITAKSKLYTTKAMYNESLDDFSNMAIAINTALSPDDLLRELKILERDAGRNMKAERNSARPLDLDIITYGHIIWQSDTLTIPHSSMHERSFVLDPLMDIAPYHAIAGTPYMVKDYWQKLHHAA